MARMKEATILARLRKAGINPADPDFMAKLHQAEKAAASQVERPSRPEDDLPGWFPRVRSALMGAGRIGILLQVITIRGLSGPAINLLLIAADIYLLSHAYLSFQPLPIALLLGIVTVLMFTYLSFVKAELRYLEHRDRREVFSLRRVRENLAYWWGAGDEWEPRYRKEVSFEFKRIRFIHSLFLSSIFVMRLGAAYITIEQANTTSSETVVAAATSILATIILLVALEVQIERSYRAYRQSEGDVEDSADFYSASLERYYIQVEEATTEARYQMMLFLLGEANKQNALPSSTSETPTSSQPESHSRSVMETTSANERTPEYPEVPAPHPLSGNGRWNGS